MHIVEICWFVHANTQKQSNHDGILHLKIIEMKDLHLSKSSRILLLPNMDFLQFRGNLKICFSVGCQT